MKRFLALFAAAVLSTLMALAADQREWGGPGFGGPPGNGPGGGGGWGRPRNVVADGMADLDEQQQELFQQSLRKDGDKLRALEDKLSVAQKEVLAAAMESPYNEKAVRAKAEEVAKIQVEIMMVRALALSLVAPMMKEEQKQQVIDSPSGFSLLTSGGEGNPFRRGLERAGNWSDPMSGGMAVFDDQQRQTFQGALDKDRQKLRVLEEQLRAAQKELVSATVNSSPFDEKIVRGRAEAVAKIQVEITMLRAKALATVAPSLNADQKQQLTGSPIGMALLNSGGGGTGPPGSRSNRGFPPQAWPPREGPR